MERSTVASLLRSTQAYCQQICEKQTFDFGIAYWNSRFPALPDANQIREVTLDDPQQIRAAQDEVNVWFAPRGLKCLRWSSALGSPSQSLSEFLTVQEYRQRNLIVFHLADWKTVSAGGAIRVLPARAVRDAFRSTFLSATEPPFAADREQWANSFMERLDDPQLDMFVAVIGNRPAGRCGLFQVGDIARILGLSILPEFADRGVEQALLAHVLGMARRLTMPMVVAQAARSDVRRSRLLQDFGFVAGGELTEFELASPFDSVAPV